MMKLQPITLVLFLLAIAVYIVAPPLGLGLAGLGVVFELAGWITLFKANRRGKEKET